MLPGSKSTEVPSEATKLVADGVSTVTKEAPKLTLWAATLEKGLLIWKKIPDVYSATALYGSAAAWFYYKLEKLGRIEQEMKELKGS